MIRMRGGVCWVPTIPKEEVPKKRDTCTEAQPFWPAPLTYRERAWHLSREAARCFRQAFGPARCVVYYWRVAAQAALEARYQESSTKVLKLACVRPVLAFARRIRHKEKSFPCSQPNIKNILASSDQTVTKRPSEFAAK